MKVIHGDVNILSFCCCLAASPSSRSILPSPLSFPLTLSLTYFNALSSPHLEMRSKVTYLHCGNVLRSRYLFTYFTNDLNGIFMLSTKHASSMLVEAHNS